MGENDVLLYIRLGNFIHQGWNSEILDYNFYLDVLKDNKFDNIYISVWPRDERYLSHFKDYKYTILDSNDVKRDFFKCDNFNHVILSNSTLHWWAVFLSNVGNIYTPKYLGQHGVNELIDDRQHVKNLSNIKSSKEYENKFIYSY